MFSRLSSEAIVLYLKSRERRDDVLKMYILNPYKYEEDQRFKSHVQIGSK